jgi:glycosyltransferase involved in cell wall biosynthesis
MRRSPPLEAAGPRLLYVSLHATAPGQKGWADVDEIVDRLRARGWTVDLHQPSYVGKAPPGGLARLFETVTLQVRLIPRLRAYDAVYVRSHALAFPIALAARVAKVPIIQECNGPSDDLFIAWPRLRLLQGPLTWASRAQYRWADEIITVTPQLGQWLQCESGHSHVTVIPNGANVELFHPDATSSKQLPSRYAVFFGSLAPWQGIATMLAATEHPDWPADVRLVIAGDGRLRGEVERAAQAGRVVFLGSCPQTELPGVVAGSIGSLIVKDHPAHAASGLSPLKLYESMAAGVPVLVSAMPGLQDTVERFDCGVVVPPGDAGAVARAVARLSCAPDLRRLLGENGRRAAVAEYSWETSTDATARVVARAIGRRA